MENTVEMHLQFDADEVLLHEVKTFLTPVAPAKITSIYKRLQTDANVNHADQEWLGAIGIFVSIVGSWATERYILDPLADKAEKWINSIQNIWRLTRTKHNINLIVKFEHSTDKLEIQVNGTPDEENIKQAWQIIQQVIHIMQSRRVILDRIRITTNKKGELLVIGYNGNPSKPKCIVNLITKQFDLLTSSNAQEVQLWEIEQLKLRLAYLTTREEKGYPVSQVEIGNLENEIRTKKALMTL